MIPLPVIPPALAVRALLVFIVIAATFAAGYVRGLSAGMERLNDYVAEQATASVKLAAKQVEVTERVVTKYVRVKGETQVVTQTVEKEVMTYANANTGNCLDADWRRLHDAAALNTVPEPASGTNGTSGTPQAATALKTVAGNYAACNRTADRLDALQAWVREQAATTAD